MSLEDKKEFELNLLSHAVLCTNPACIYMNCGNMKTFLEHKRSCPIKVKGGCDKCMKYWVLIVLHAEECDHVECPVPDCDFVKKE
jgi:E1A/CREB-binding protein